MPPQAGRLSAFPQISQQQSQVATAAAAASSNSRTGAFVGSIGGAGSSVGSGAPTGASGNGGSVVGAGSSGTAAAAGSQFSLQQAVANNVTTVSSGLPGSSGGGVLPSAAVNRSLYNQQPQHHMTNSNSLGFTSPSSRMSPNSFSASLHQQASFAGLTSATKRRLDIRSLILLFYISCYRFIRWLPEKAEVHRHCNCFTLKSVFGLRTS